MDNCNGKFSGLEVSPKCTGFFDGCQCTATATTCGARQSCDLNGCAGTFDSKGVAHCQGNFKGCECTATIKTCGVIQNCNLNGCNGAFTSGQGPPVCTGKFPGCPCLTVASTCGTEQSCSKNGCNGAIDSSGTAVCMNNFFGCPCILDTPPPPASSPAPPPPSQTPTAPSGPSQLCVAAHCYTSSSLFAGDFTTVQFYSSSQYLFLLQAAKTFASSETNWNWNNIVDSNGNTWSIHVSGNCGSLSYQSSLQGNQGFITMELDSRHQNFTECDIGTAVGHCSEAESTYMDSSCPS